MREKSRAARLVTLAVAILALPAAAAAPPLETAAHRALLAELDGHLTKGDLAAASALMTRIERETSASERLAFDVLYVLISRGRIAEAREQWNRLGARLQEGLRTRPGTPHDAAAEAELRRRFAEASFLQGLLLARDGEREEALALLRKADGLGFPPLDSPLMLLAAECLLDLGEHAMASRAYREILKRSPKNPAARLGLGVALFSSGSLRAAETELDGLLREAPETPHVRLWLGAVLLEQKRSDEARRHLESEWTADPLCVACAAKLGHLAYLAGDDAQCLAWTAKALAIDPTHAEANLVTGMLANRKGDHALAIRHLSGVVERVPTSLRARYQIAIAYRRSGDAQKAREQMEVYDRLLAAQKADSLGVRGSGER